MRRRAGEIVVSVPPNVALYLLNQKRHTLSEIEKRYGFSVTIEADDELHAADCEIERVRARRDDRERPGPELARASYEEVSDEAPADEAEGAEDREAGERTDERGEREDGDRDGGRRRRRRRRRRSGRRDEDGESDRPQAMGSEDQPDDRAGHGTNGAADERAASDATMGRTRISATTNRWAMPRARASAARNAPTIAAMVTANGAIAAAAVAAAVDVAAGARTAKASSATMAEIMARRRSPPHRCRSKATPSSTCRKATCRSSMRPTMRRRPSPLPVNVEAAPPPLTPPEPPVVASAPQPEPPPPPPVPVIEAPPEKPKRGWWRR